MPTRPFAFFSYARADKEFAHSLAQRLRAAGASVWVDVLDIPAGSRWDVEVEQALEAATHLLVVLSPAAVASSNVKDEISEALRRELCIVPVMHIHCKVPLRLSRVQYIDLMFETEEGLRALLSTLPNAAGSSADEKTSILRAVVPSVPIASPRRHGFSKSGTYAVAASLTLFVAAGIWLVKHRDRAEGQKLQLNAGAAASSATATRPLSRVESATPATPASPGSVVTALPSPGKAAVKHEEQARLAELAGNVSELKRLQSAAASTPPASSTIAAPATQLRSPLGGPTTDGVGEQSPPLYVLHTAATSFEFALGQKERLAWTGVPATLALTGVGKGLRYRVSLGPFKTKEEAVELQARLARNSLATVMERFPPE